MRTEQVICDGCGHDLTTRSNSVDYRLTLAAESKPGYGAGVYTDMMIYPPIERAHHFCGLGCLDHWRDRERRYDELQKERHEAWVREHGSTDANGRVRSWPCPPQDLQEREQAECREQALAEFPISRPPRAQR